MRRERLRQIAAMICAGAALAGCVAMNAASTVTSATVQTVGAVGRAATGTANVVNRTVQQIPAAMMYGAGANRRIVIPVNRTTRSTVPVRAARPVTPVRTATTSTTSKRAKVPPKKSTKRADEFLEVMPPELLDQLTQDQINLQALVQSEALAGPVGETVYWDVDDRSGTSRAEEPHAMGAFTCRVMVESLKIDGTATESRATACRTEATAWTLSF